MRILTGEPYFLPLAFSLNGGGVLHDLSCPPLKPVTCEEGSELTSSLLYKVKERFYWETALFSLGVFTRGELFSMNLPFPLLKISTQRETHNLPRH